jgi:glycosyltransferase involved in cell wall biosynthesis
MRNTTRHIQPGNISRVLKGLAQLPGQSAELAGLLKDEYVDILHTNHAIAHIWGGMAAKKAELPCVMHFHEPMFGFARFFFMNRAKALASRILTIDPWTSSMFSIGNLVNIPNIIVQNGFDFSRFDNPDPQKVRKEFGLAEDDLVISYISHLAPHKQQKQFLEAIKPVLMKHDNVRTLIVGGPVYKANPDYDVYLKVFAEQLGISSRVIFTGERRDMPEVMAATDIVAVVPENVAFTRIAVEAMAMGKPVIASKMKRPSFLMEDGITGMLVPPHSVEALRHSIIALIADPKLREDLGSAAYTYVRNKFQADKVARSIETVYGDILKSHAPMI